jgi:hypothetical protein
MVLGMMYREAHTDVTAERFCGCDRVNETQAVPDGAKVDIVVRL